MLLAQVKAHRVDEYNDVELGQFFRILAYINTEQTQVVDEFGNERIFNTIDLNIREYTDDLWSSIVSGKFSAL